MNQMYSNALGSLAAGMSGGHTMPDGSYMAGGMDDMGGEPEIPCPLCGGTGMVTESMLTGGGEMMPARLAARQPMMPQGGGGMQMQPSQGSYPMS